MWFKIRTSEVSNPGKLWTGSTDFWGELNGRVVDVQALFIRSSRSTASTLKLVRGSGGVLPKDAEEAIGPVPTLFVTAGGVGSITSGVRAGENPPNIEHIRTWNWSKRTGGHIIVDPVAALSGRQFDPPPAKAGYVWIQTYGGATLDEYVLLQLDEEGKIDQKHILVPVMLERLSPPEREDDNFQETVKARPELEITLQDAIHAGFCAGGVERYRDEHFPERDTVTLAELLPLMDDRIKKIVEWKMKKISEEEKA
jgi:hypothetical protein